MFDPIHSNFFGDDPLFCDMYLKIEVCNPLKNYDMNKTYHG